MNIKSIKNDDDLTNAFIRLESIFQADKGTSENWLLEHQQEIFRTDIEVKEIAKNLNQTERQIMYARKELKLLLDNIGRRNDKKAWVEKYWNEPTELSINQLQRKYNLSFD